MYCICSIYFFKKKNQLVRLSIQSLNTMSYNLYKSDLKMYLYYLLPRTRTNLICTLQVKKTIEFSCESFVTKKVESSENCGFYI